MLSMIESASTDNDSPYESTAPHSGKRGANSQNPRAGIASRGNRVRQTRPERAAAKMMSNLLTKNKRSQFSKERSEATENQGGDKFTALSYT